MEHDVLREYFDAESTPASAIVLSALSQLWIFGLYEVLRTWRQRVIKILNFGEEIKDLSVEKRLARLVNLPSYRMETAKKQQPKPSAEGDTAI